VLEGFRHRQTIPAILNKRWGYKPPSSLVYSQVIEDIADNEGGFRERLPLERIRTNNFGDLFPHFPILRELVASVKTQCECGDCVEESSTGEIRKVIREGCYAHLALTEVMVLLSHSVADSLGVDDASARQQTDVLVRAMVGLLSQLVDEIQVAWNV
jgi:hypothetical protein